MESALRKLEGVMDNKEIDKDDLLNSTSLEALSCLFIDNNRSAIFQLSLKGDILTNHLRFLFHDFSYINLKDVDTLSGLIDKIDPKSEICEVKGVKCYHEEVVNEIIGEQRKTTTYIPLKINGKCLPFELKLVRMEETGTMLGVIMELDEKSYNIEKLYADSYKDQMTGLFNKNALNYHFSKNTDSHYLGFMDLDYFKAFNDKFSHSTGDQILHGVGQKLVGLADKHVIFYRVGGDEFAFMTIDLEYDETLDLIHRIQEALLTIDFFDVKLHFSIGFSYFSSLSDDCTIQEALLFADYGMYLSKGSAKEKVHYIDPEKGEQIKLKGDVLETVEAFVKTISRS